jgi:formylglycine-generating enzyme required for sulfatase activity
MADIFLSYAREDEARAAVVARVLGELGWSVFWDRRIIAGTSWDEVVERELQACRCVVVLWSAASIGSRWVKTEARFALERSALVPANLDPSKPPLEFRFLESAQLHAWQGATDDSEFSVLAEGIAQHVKPARRESNVEPIATPIAALERERAPTVPAQTSDAVVVVDEMPRVVGSRVRSDTGDYAPELAPRQSWTRKQWIPIASAAAVLVVTAGIYLPTRTGPQVSDTSASTPADSKTPATGAPARGPEPQPANPIVTPPPPTQATPTGRSGSAGDVNAKTPPRTDVKTGPLPPGTSPTPRPVPFGAPVRFRTDMWSLPDEPLLGFVEIPAGQFTMGSDRRQDPEAGDEELPQHKVDLPRYYIGRYEVTVAQFRAFVQASGYREHPTEALDRQADLPVVNVRWHNAVAYATWLDKSLHESRATPVGVRSILSTAGQPCRVTLPSEAEWEKAARGIDARVYPWGGKFDPAKANVGLSGQGTPMPVGSYPDGSSPYGVLDMIGNVWEWTRSLWRTNSDGRVVGYPYNPSDSQHEDLEAPDTVRRVIRGGSSYGFLGRARAAYRLSGAPRDRDDYLGFRVVVSCSRS